MPFKHLIFYPILLLGLMCSFAYAQTPTGSLTASATSIYLGGSVTLTPTFTGGTGSIPGIGAVSSGIAYTVTPTVTTSYLLTVVGSGNVPTYATSNTVTVTVSNASLTAARTSIYSGTSTSITPTFATGTATLSPSIPGFSGPLVSGSAISVSPTTTTTYTLTITGSVPTPLNRSVTIAVSAAPQPIITFATTSGNTIYATLGDTVTRQAITNLSGSGYGAISYSSSNQSVATINSINAAATTLNVGYSIITANQAAALGYNSLASTTYNLNVIRAPVAVSLNTSNSAIYAGDSALLTPNFSLGSGSVNGVGAVQSGNSYSVTPIVTTNYVLSVVNLAGRVATTSPTRITVYPAPVLSFAKTTGVYVTVGGTTTDTLTTSLSGSPYGSISYTTNNASIANVNATSGLVSGVAVGNAVITANQALTTNVNASASKSFTVSVVPAPQITSLTASTTSIVVGGSSQITPRFTNGTGTITSIGNVTSNVAYTVLPVATTTYTLNVTNLAGTSVTQPVTINVATRPVLTFTRPSSIGLTVGSSYTNIVNSTLSGGSYGAITFTSSNPSVATVDSATGLVSGVSIGLAQITATQAAVPGQNSASTQTYYVGVVAGPTITSFTSTSSSIVSGASIRITPVFANGTGTINTLGTVYSGVSYYLTPSASTTYTLTVTNAALATNPSVTQNLVITVNSIPVPTLSFNQAYTNGQTSFSLGAFTSFTNLAHSNYSAANCGVITYSSSNTSVARVDQLTGVVSAYGQGSATITATQAASTGVNATASASYNITVVANPIAQSLVCTPTIVIGQQGTIVPSFLSGTGTISQIGTVVSGQGYTVSPTASTTYTLVVTNSLGRTSSVTGTITVLPLASPTITFVKPTAVTISIGDTLANTALSSYFGSNYGPITYTISNSSIASVGSGSGVLTGLTAGTATVTATQAALALRNNSASGTYQVTVVPLPVATSLTVGTDNVTLGTSTTITPVFSGGTATVTGVTGTITSGTSYTITPTRSGYYFLNVTNAAGATSYKLLFLTVNPPPAGLITFASGTMNLTLNTTATNVATASLTGNGYGTIAYGTSNSAIAAVNSVTGAVTGVSLGSAVITATQLASVGKNSYSSQGYAVNVVAPPVITSFYSGLSSLIQGIPTTVVGVFSGGTATLTGVPGPIYTGRVYTINPVITGNAATGTAVYTLNVTNIANTSVTANVAIAVSAATPPVIRFYPTSPSVIPNGAQITQDSNSSVSFITLLVNTTCNVVPTSNIAGYFTFSSSNAAVASVDPNTGLVTAISPGSATITTNVTLPYGTYSKSYTVNVAGPLPAAPQVSSVITGIGSVQVNFTAPLLATLPAIDHYIVTAIPSGGGSVLTIRSPASAGTSIVLNGLNINTTYAVSVKASNYSGSGIDTGIGSSSVVTLISTYVSDSLLNGTYVAVTPLISTVSVAQATGSIGINTFPTQGDTLKWTNSAQTYWSLIPNYTASQLLAAGADLTAIKSFLGIQTCPIYTAGSLIAVGAPGSFILISYQNQICGFMYLGQYFARSGVTQPHD
jgi:uncharacterized protein YjdB